MRIDRRTLLVGAVGFAHSALAQRSTPVTLTEWLAADSLSRESAAKSLVERIRVLDRDIRAWVQVSPQSRVGDGPLREIPFGVKDIFETRDLATEYGSPLFSGRVGSSDAAIVRQLRGLGGTLLGKTHTATFAYRTPPPTRNPRNLNHTPGGSSSGSAAAVAAGMAPLALGTQTGGSIVRPASFCGITGFKPSYGLLPLDGVLPLAPSFDTLGFFAHTGADMLAFWDTLGQPTGRPEDFDLASPDPMPDVEPEMAGAFTRTLEQLRVGGVTVRSIDIAPMLSDLRQTYLTVLNYEGARVHESRYREYGDRLDDATVALVRDGLGIPEMRYDEARASIDQCRSAMIEHFNRTPVILTPAALGPALPGLASTGSSQMNSPWSTLGTPAITIPMPIESGLPLGLQLTAAHGQDARLLQTAVKLERLLL